MSRQSVRVARVKRYRTECAVIAVTSRRNNMGIRLMCIGVVVLGLIFFGLPPIWIGVAFIVAGAVLALIGK